MSQEPILKARGLVKRYGRVTALDQADFDLYPGEILAVIGDNGAGKSSLIKALSGAVTPDEGEIHLDGQKVQFTSPMQAREAGIETVCTRTSRSRRLCRLPTTCSSARNPPQGTARRYLPPARPQRNAARCPRKALRACLMTIQNINQAVETLLGRPASGRGRGACRGLRLQGRHHGRTDGCPWCEGIAPRSRAHPRRPLARPADRAHLAQHAHVFEVADRIHIHRWASASR